MMDKLEAVSLALKEHWLANSSAPASKYFHSMARAAINAIDAFSAPAGERADLIGQVAEHLEPWAWETQSYNATVARDDAVAKAEQIVALFHQDRQLLEALRRICEEDVTSTEMVQIASAALANTETDHAG